uniref:PHD finger protein ALFIN-LIKE n=1 Tax=Aegilops tauschii subsp. strangulata TaxID=200361 RepID=A0A453HGQ3_AEGTS
AIPPAKQASAVNLQLEPRCDSKAALRSPELAIPFHYLHKIHLLGWSPIPSLFFLKPYYSPRPVASATKTLTLAPELRRRSRLQMDGGGTHRTPEDVFRDFRARRAGMIKALTTDVEKFYQQCDPEKENLCLYGLPNETWEVNLPAEEVPPELPEPALGINFARDGMDEKDWLSLVAVHSDAWLLAVAFYFGARFGFDKESRGSGFLA